MAMLFRSITGNRPSTAKLVFVENKSYEKNEVFGVLFVENEK
jgi:hypothetical protein